MHRQEWKLPFNIAIGFHIIVAVSCIYGPHIFDSKPKHEQIYTVDLTNFADPSPQLQAPPKNNPPPEEITATKKIARKTAPIAKAAPEPVPEVAPKKAISLKPEKRKIKKKITPKQEPKPNNNEKIKRQKLAEAIRAQEVAEEAAKIAQQEAELERKLMEANLADAKRVVQENNSRQSNNNSNTSNSSSALSGIQKQYLNAIVSHLHGYWQLPEHKNWSSTLATTVAVTISSNGKVKSMYIEQGSGDRVFDQFVLKALRAADPLPNIPPAMRKKQFDIGLVFKPGSIQ